MYLLLCWIARIYRERRQEKCYKQKVECGYLSNIFVNDNIQMHCYRKYPVPVCSVKKKCIDCPLLTINGGEFGMNESINLEVGRNTILNQLEQGGIR